MMKKYRFKGLLSVAVALLMLVPLGAVSQTVPVGTRLLIRLDTEISSKSNRVGDGFTATVISPRSYRGAIIRGHISHLDKSGRLKGKTEIGLDFDSIEYRNGRRASLRAELLEVRQNESIKVVDEEGNIHSGSRGKQTIKRTAIGAAIGGVLGALIGGRKGAVIGLIVGAGAGAGSLIVDGSKELKLEPGTEMLIRTLRHSRRDIRDR
jgi:hypothetical protein